MLDNIRNTLLLSDQAYIISKFLDIPEDNIDSEDVLKECQKRVVVALEYKEIFQSYKLLQKLKEKILETDVNLMQKYQEVLVWLYYISFGILSKEEIIYFFKENDISIILQDDIYFDLIDRVKLRLISVLMSERDKWREKIYNAMHENQNILTKNFMIQGSRATIANWLKEYDKKIGTSIAESIIRANFENESSNKAHLSETEKILLRRFFDFYEFIKISSYDPAGFEEDVVIESEGKTYINVNGELVEVGDNARHADFDRHAELVSASVSGSIEQTLNQVQGDGGQNDKIKTALPSQSAIAKEAGRILSGTKGELSGVLNQLQNSIESGVPLGSCAALLLLAQLRLLDNVLEDERFVRLIMNDLKRNAQDGSEQGVRINPTAPMYIARFLKVVLEDELNLDHEDGMRFGGKLAQILAVESEKYRGIIKDNRWNI